MKRQKIIVVCGPTATGKSDHAVALAKRIGGEVVSADSRQVYRGLDIGSGKITKREMRGVPHHLLDVADPRRAYSAARYQRDATKAVAGIIRRGKVPIICGGTGFYIDALVYGTSFPAVPPNAALRQSLTKRSVEELAMILMKLDPDRYATIEQRNKVRLIRAIEIATALGSVPKLSRAPRYDVEWVYLDFSDAVLKERIHARLTKRMRQGMVAEVRKLHEKKGVSWKRLESLGLEYRYLARFLQGKTGKEEMLIQLESAIWKYAKRQRTWFKKYGR